MDARPPRRARRRSRLRDLAAMVGLRQPSLYAYFDSKHALYDAMFAEGNRAAPRRDCRPCRRTTTLEKQSATSSGCCWSSRPTTSCGTTCCSSARSQASSRPKRRTRWRSSSTSGGAPDSPRPASPTRATSTVHGAHRWARRPAGRQRPGRRPVGPPHRPRRRRCSSPTSTCDRRPREGSPDDHDHATSRRTRRRSPPRSSTTRRCDRRRSRTGSSRPSCAASPSRTGRSPRTARCGTCGRWLPTSSARPPARSRLASSSARSASGKPGDGRDRRAVLVGRHERGPGARARRPHHRAAHRRVGSVVPEGGAGAHEDAPA